MAHRLSVVLALQSRIVPRWILKVILRLRDSGELTFPDVFLFFDPDSQPSHSVVYRLHEQLDRAVFKNDFNYDQPEDLLSVLENPRIRLFKDSHSLQPESFMKEEWDVLLNFSDVDIPHWLADHFRHGFLNYSVDPPLVKTGMDPVYRALVRREPYLMVSVSWTSNSNSGKKVIHRSCVPIDRNSIFINRKNAYGLSETIIPRLISGLYNFGVEYLRQQVLKFKDDKVPDEGLLHPSIQPTNYKAIRNMAGIMTDFIRRKVFFRSQFRWYLMLDKTGALDRLKSMDSFKSLYPPDGCFWADPFLLREGGRTFLFAEEFVYRLDKGHISVIELDNQANIVSNTCIIEMPYHMSYPFVFKVDDTFFMIPETSGNRSIDLYQCMDFPFEWKFVRNLAVNIDAVDTTLFYHDKVWWMFTAVCVMPDFPDYRELFLYYSDNPLSKEWHSHPMNPVVSDIRNGRPAGGVFTREGKLYRPAQDCSGRYGRAINFNEITEINALRYSERKVSRISPNWNHRLKGVHTFNSCSKMQVIDVYEYYKRFGS